MRGDATLTTIERAWTVGHPACISLKAIEADDKGYASPDAQKELKKLIGAADPSKG